MKNKKIIIFTALPFGKSGNQSLYRFVMMLLRNNFIVIMYSSSTRKSKQEVHSLVNSNLVYKKLFSFHEYFLSHKPVNSRNDYIEDNDSPNYFKKIKSEDIIPPFGGHTTKTAIKKWFLFILYILDNIVVFLRFTLFHSKDLSSSCGVIGYECGYTLCSKMLASTFGKPYINKFQGTILKCTNRNVAEAVKYYPLNYFGINSSDLCIMVNDGTDGKYYANHRGCKNIFFATHGVADKEYQLARKKYDLLRRYKDKFVIFNNASGSSWKRVDRIVRALSLVNKKVLNRLIFLTTYRAPDKRELVRYCKSLGLENHIEFLDKIDHLQSNYLVRNSQLLIMTNEMSNLGNPVLEAIYYGTPIISINDYSLDSNVVNGEGALLVDLNEDFDKNLADAITRCVEDSYFYSSLQHAVKENATTHTVEKQQLKEFAEIDKIFKK